ncbi:MAG: DnaA regulatory inactivator Hda [Gammaproteobacteria bacterium]
MQFLAQIPLGLKLREGVTFGNFLAGDNGEAVKFLSQYTGRPSTQAVFIWGDKGVGKTHLLQAACHNVAITGKSTAYIPLTMADEFSSAYLEEMENMSLVCIDDVDMIAGQSDWEYALFHLYNRIHACNGHLIIAGNASPGHLGIKLRDLSSRLGWGWVFHMEQLTDEQKLELLKQRTAERGMHLPDEVAQYMLRHCPRDTHTLFSLIDHLDDASLTEKRRLTIPFVKSILGAGIE